MKTTLMKFATVAAMAAGMTFAQAPATTPSTPPAQKAAKPRVALRRRLLQALNLTDAQKAQAKTIFQQNKQNLQPMREQTKQNREALAAAVKANDTAKIQQLSGVQGNLQGQMLAMRSESMAKFYAILTPDQKAKADQILQRMKQRVEQRRAGQQG